MHRGDQACAVATSLHTSPTHAGSPTRVKAQPTIPCVTLISTMHVQPFLISLIEPQGITNDISYQVHNVSLKEIVL